MTVRRQPPLDRYATTLHGLARKDRLRALSPRSGLDFTSNDYLGLASSPRLAGAVAAALAEGTPVGATGSRLLRGNAPEHERLEALAADLLRRRARDLLRWRLYRQFRGAHHPAPEGGPPHPRPACPRQRTRGRARRPGAGGGDAAQ